MNVKSPMFVLRGNLNYFLQILKPQLFFSDCARFCFKFFKFSFLGFKMSEPPSISCKATIQQVKIEKSVDPNISESSQSPAVVNTSKQKVPNPDNVGNALQ
jgi:hypothetical protein